MANDTGRKGVFRFLAGGCVKLVKYGVMAIGVGTVVNYISDKVHDKEEVKLSDNDKTMSGAFNEATEEQANGEKPNEKSDTHNLSPEDKAYLNKMADAEQSPADGTGYQCT